MQQKPETTKRSNGRIAAGGNGISFLGRDGESRRITEALRKKESLMIAGPADIGKTTLIQNVIRNLPGDLRPKCLYLPGFKDLQNLLRSLINALHQANSPGLHQQLKAARVSDANFDVWLKALPSSKLKGIVYQAAETGDYRIIFDHIPLLTHARAKIIKELFWMRDTPVYLLIRNGPKSRIAQWMRFFYWSNRQCLTLGPLAEPVAGELLEACIKKFQLSSFDLEEFRDEVLALSGGAPGAIVKMCALAAEPRHQYGSRIKTKLVHIDYLMSGSSPGHSRERKAR